MGWFQWAVRQGFAAWAVRKVCMRVKNISSASTSRVVPQPRVLTVAQAQATLKNNPKLTVALADSAANIKANLPELAKWGAQVKSVSLTNASDNLSVNATEAGKYADLLAKTPTSSLTIVDGFAALDSNLSGLRKLKDNIKTIVITPSPAGTKQKIDPYDSQLWAKSVNGRFEISTKTTSGGTPTKPNSTNQQTGGVVTTGTTPQFGAVDISKSLANNYLAIKALDDRGLLAGIESIDGGTITANVDQSQKLAAIFQKYDTAYYLNIRDTSANISKGIDFIAANNSKLAGITQIGNIKPLQITREQNIKADKALSKMKNAYSLYLYK
jgi:hypothetical protein